MTLSKAQQTVIENAKEEIDFARTHNFYDWYRHYGSLFERKLNDEEIDSLLDERERTGWKTSKEIERKKYEMNRNGISYLCHATGATLKKLKTLGLIEIIKDSTGETFFGFDTIKILNY